MRREKQQRRRWGTDGREDDPGPILQKKWTEEGHQRLTIKAAFFYAEDGVVASTDPGWLLLLTGLFDRVGLWINVSKNVGIMF